MKLFDKNYEELYVGADVEVPTPTSEDSWNFEFQGTVVKLEIIDGYVVVEDMEGDCFMVEAERVEIL